MRAVRLRIVLLALALVVATACSSGSAAPAGARVFHVGLFHVGLDHVPRSLQGLEDALAEMGYIDGQNIEYDWRNQKDSAQAGETALEFVREKKDLIVAFENQTIQAAKTATTTVPVVFLHATDPVSQGFVASLASPGGNLTGMVGFPVLAEKQLEMFKNVLPSLQRVLILTDPSDPAAAAFVEEARAAAAALDLVLVERSVADEAEINRVFDELEPGDVDGVMTASQVVQTKFSDLLIDLSRSHGLPFMVADRSRVEKGGLLSYGPDFRAVGRAAAVYVDRILKGTKPADLPVEKMTQLELVINQAIADDLGLDLSPQWLDAAALVITE
jgi:putative tryptophan/tyrosine transport system substrate-binding protein